jgi:predicted oxidoreductase
VNFMANEARGTSPAPHVEHADVVIVGAGAAGAAAALEVCTAGRSFLLVDRLPTFGGTATTSGGGCCIAGTPLQREAGIDDTPELAIGDLLRAGGPTADEAWATFYFRHAAGDVYGWLVERGVEWEYVKPQEHDSVPRWHAPRGAGRAVMDALLRSIEAAGVTDRLRLATVVDELVWAGDAVVGVSGTAPDGTVREFRGSAVVMATGGFAGNPEMVRRHAPALAAVEQLLVGGGAGALGDGHRLLAGAGAKLVNMASMWTYAYATPDYRDPTGRRGLVVRGTQGGIWVNRAGIRFHDELLDGGGSATPALLAQRPPACWAILDRAKLEAIRVADPYFRFGTTIETTRLDELVTASPWIVEANDLRDLATHAGIDPPGLAATVAAWNALVASGAPSDPLTGRDLAAALAIEGPPFYAIRFVPLVRKNLGGVRTDLRTRVLRTDGSPIDGLYAAGELCGFAGGHLAGAIAQEGIMIGASLFSGRVAGAWAAHRAGGPRPTGLDAGTGAESQAAPEPSPAT